MLLMPRTQATLLLTSYLSKPSKDEPKPLSPTEWSSFAKWLHANGLTPEALLLGSPNKELENFNNPKIAKDRIIKLLSRGGELALVSEKWERAGIWIISRSDAEYPQKLKQRLKEAAPPIIYGCGNKTLLSKGGVAIVGSRNANEKLLKVARTIGFESAKSGYSVVSGGARGVDEEAMAGSFDADGTTIGVLSDSLLKSVLSSKYRKALSNNDLLLISIAHPEAGFSVGSAMGRNKFIYCLSDTSIVVSSAKESGGTWSGAVENMKNGWVPLWVYDDKSLNGNQALIEKCRNSFDDNSIDIEQFIKSPNIEDKEDAPYLMIIEKIKSAKEPLSKNDLKHFFEFLKVKELDGLLKTAVDKKVIEKTNKPIKYYIPSYPQQSLLGLSQ